MLSWFLRPSWSGLSVLKSEKTGTKSEKTGTESEKNGSKVGEKKRDEILSCFAGSSREIRALSRGKIGPSR